MCGAFCIRRHSASFLSCRLMLSSLSLIRSVMLIFLNSLTSAMVSPAFKIIVVTSPSLMYLHVCNIIVPSS